MKKSKKEPLPLWKRILSDPEVGPPRTKQMIALAVLATVALLSADLWTKSWAQENLSRERPGTPPAVCVPGPRGGAPMQRLPKLPPDDSVVLIEGTMELRYAENCGAAFGLLDDQPSAVRRVVFGLAGVIATIVLFVLFVRGSGGPLFSYSVPLIVSGAVGNLIDRARLEYVVDFIRVHSLPSWLSFGLSDGNTWEYPTFNVADITITIGVALLIIDGVLVERAEKRAKLEKEAKEREEKKSAKTKSGKKNKRSKPKTTMPRPKDEEE